jgi:hypothetical protein
MFKLVGSLLLAGTVMVAVAQQPLDSPAAPGSAQPNLALGARNEVYMSWLEPADSGHALMFSVLSRGRWSQPRRISSGRDFIANWADFPSIEVLGEHRLAAHWLQKSGSGKYAYGVRISQSADGGDTWSQPVTPHRDTTQTEHGFVALWRERNALGAVWLDGRKFTQDEHSESNEMQLMTTSLQRDGSLTSESVLDARTCDCCQNAAAMTANGPVIVYRDRSANEIRDIYVTRRVNGRWLPGRAVANDNWKINACPVNGPAIAAQANRVAVAWFTAANDTARVRVAFSRDAAASFSAPVRIDAGNPAGRVDVGLLPNGDALVSWVERTGGEASEIRARVVSRSGKLGKSMIVAKSTAARASGFPRFVIAGPDAVFAWTVPGKPSAVKVARLRVTEFQ